MRTSEYVPHLSYGSRVRFIGTNHPKSGQQCVIIRVLPNPSQMAEKQWYDVRFDDSSIGRFVETQLMLLFNNCQITAA
jgi:hypothetical protein